MRTCSVCGKNSLSNKERSYHKFPVNRLELLEKWVRNIREADGSWEPSRSSVLCSDHFVRDCFNTASSERPRLRANAIPTLFDDVSKKKQGSPNQIMGPIQEGSSMSTLASEEGRCVSRTQTPLVLQGENTVVLDSQGTGPTVLSALPAPRCVLPELEAVPQNVSYAQGPCALSNTKSITKTECLTDVYNFSNGDDYADIGASIELTTQGVDEDGTAFKPSCASPAKTDCNIVISEVWGADVDGHAATSVRPPEEPVAIECETVVCKMECPSPPADECDVVAPEEPLSSLVPACHVYAHISPLAATKGLELIKSQRQHFVYNLSRPSPAWTRHTYVYKSGSVGYAVLSVDDSLVDPVAVEKLVLFDKNGNGTLLGKVFLHGMMRSAVDIANREQAEELLRTVDKLQLCCGVGKRADLKGVRLGNVQESGGRLFSEGCEVQFADAVLQRRRCPPCGALRKQLIGRLSKINAATKAPTEMVARKMRCMAQNLRRRDLRIVQLTEQLRQMRETNVAMKRALLAKLMCDHPESGELPVLKES